MFQRVVFLFILAKFISCYEFNNLPIKKLSNNRVVCRNEVDGEELDWFTLYKLPKQTQSIDKTKKLTKTSFMSNGTAYAFMTNKDTKWKLSSLSINDTSSLPGQTLDAIYAAGFGDTNIGYIFYNDQAENLTLTKGHTKGIILFNQDSAVWIVHSIPHYPPKQSSGKYFINPPQCFFGQSMMCASFNFNQLDMIGQQLLYTYPQIFDYYIPEDLKLKQSSVLENLLSVINGNFVNKQPWYNVNLLTTIGGEKLLSFAKFTDFQDDLYSGLVAPNLKSNLLTETWNNGAGTFSSNCSAQMKYHVMNIQEVKFDFLNLKFSVHHDHSKWAVTSLKSEENIFYFAYNFVLKKIGIKKDEDKMGCIGDINRQVDQLNRGGGTVCFINEYVWEQYYNLISDFDKCK